MLEGGGLCYSNMPQTSGPVFYPAADFGGCGQQNTLPQQIQSPAGLEEHSGSYFSVLQAESTSIDPLL